jgi:hypothetical protein
LASVSAWPGFSNSAGDFGFTKVLIATGSPREMT